MPAEISRLRRWIAIAAITLTLAVAGIYFYSQQRVQNALNQVPEKIGLDIQQTAHGFTISKSEQGRTLFKVQASKAVQFKQGGKAELHDVTITLYGRDSSRFDQIYGATFDYDPQSGAVVGKGEVQIDLQSNPEGVTKPDQSPPKELKNPIHLKTTELAFNQKTGNASTREKVDFYIPGAIGSAVGVDYVANTSVLTMQSQVNIVFSGSTGATVTAIHGTITKDPHLVVLDLPHLQTHSQQSDADQATLFLRPDNTVERLLALGHVHVESEGKQPAQVRSDQLEMLMGEQQNTVRTATFSHNVQMEVSGTQPMQGSAGRAILHFVGKNQLTTVHTEENVKLTQHQKPATSSATAQDLELTAPVVDFWLAPGNLLKRAQTSGPAKITIRPATSSPGQETLITAGKFTGRFDQFGQLSSVHGAPNGRIVNQNPGQNERVSTSDTLDASFRTGVGIESIVQQGHVFYVDDERKAWADHARYTPADQMLFLTGSPRVIDGSSTTTAHTMRMNRATGDAFAEGDIRSTYSELKEQPNGALLASSSPIHVTSRSMTGHRSSAVAVYTGDARLWQDANLVKAPSIEFRRRGVGSPGAQPAWPDRAGVTCAAELVDERLGDAVLGRVGARVVDRVAVLDRDEGVPSADEARERRGDVGRPGLRVHEPARRAARSCGTASVPLSPATGSASSTIGAASVVPDPHEQRAELRRRHAVPAREPRAVDDPHACERNAGRRERLAHDHRPRGGRPAPVDLCADRLQEHLGGEVVAVVVHELEHLRERIGVDRREHVRARAARPPVPRRRRGSRGRAGARRSRSPRPAADWRPACRRVAAVDHERRERRRLEPGERGQPSRRCRSVSKKRGVSDDRPGHLADALAPEDAGQPVEPGRSSGSGRRSP